MSKSKKSKKITQYKLTSCETLFLAVATRLFLNAMLDLLVDGEIKSKSKKIKRRTKKERGRREKA